MERGEWARASYFGYALGRLDVEVPDATDEGKRSRAAEFAAHAAAVHHGDTPVEDLWIGWAQMRHDLHQGVQA